MFIPFCVFDHHLLCVQSDHVCICLFAMLGALPCFITTVHRERDLFLYKMYKHNIKNNMNTET